MDKKIFNSEQFFKDLGFNLIVEQYLTTDKIPTGLGETSITSEAKVEAVKSNVVAFKNPKDVFPDLDVPEYAVWLALKNLVATYGIEKVEEGMVDLKKIAG